MGLTFAEKIFNASKGSIVFKKPDIVLSHDNTSSIENTFRKMGGTNVADPARILIVLDHNAPPTNSKLANDYQKIRNIVTEQGIKKFHDVGEGICHQIMSMYAKPGMLIVGSDSHTSTAGAFNAFAAGIDRTETAGLWKQGETWFRVPESIKITLTGKLNKGVFAKDLALWIIGMIGSSGADYMSIEYHGDGVNSLSISDRMTLSNLASEMGAKNAVFPLDKTLSNFFNNNNSANSHNSTQSAKHHAQRTMHSTWADKDAEYFKEISIDLNDICPVVAAPHHVDNVKTVSEVEGTKLNQALIGTCTNGRIEDLRIASEVLDGKKLPFGFQLHIIPASISIYLQAMKEGLIENFIKAGANVLSPSCGPCLGTGQGIPADGAVVISTANRNFLGRMGNPKSSIYLASPATVALSAINGQITDPRSFYYKNVSFTDSPLPFHHNGEQAKTIVISKDDNRYNNSVWNYSDIDNLNTDQMFAGNLTYNINSSEADKIMPYLFKGFDDSFTDRVKPGELIIAGSNFGCGSSREHPSVGLAFAGIKAVIVKSVNRIFFRSSVNQGLPIIILPDAVVYFNKLALKNKSLSVIVTIDFDKGLVNINDKQFSFAPLPEKLMNIFKAKGLVNYIKS